MQHWTISSCCSFVASVLFEVALCVAAGLVLEEEVLVVEEEVRSAAITSANMSSKSSSAV
jgi:P pilus assembly chaperone PapD